MIGLIFLKGLLLYDHSNIPLMLLPCVTVIYLFDLQMFRKKEKRWGQKAKKEKREKKAPEEQDRTCDRH